MDDSNQVLVEDLFGLEDPLAFQEEDLEEEVLVLGVVDLETFQEEELQGVVVAWGEEDLVAWEDHFDAFHFANYFEMGVVGWVLHEEHAPPYVAPVAYEVERAACQEVEYGF